jgi:hypothetical protein
VALVGRFTLRRVERPEVIAAEKLPGVLNETLLNPVAGSLARSEAVGQAKPANLDGAIQGDGLEKRRTVRDISEIGLPVKLDHDNLVRAGKLERLFDAAGPVNRCRRRPRQSVLAGHDP